MLTVSQTGLPAVNISDVLFGEVWACSGQSNMAFILENAMNGSALVQDANNHPELRFMTTRKTTSTMPLQELIGPIPLKWSVSNNLSVSDDGKRRTQGQASVGTMDDNWLYMSAVCYLFGRDLHTARDVPVGLINTNWGGTRIEDWSSQEAIDQCTAPSPMLRASTHLFNAMVSPLLNQTIKGAVWYQVGDLM
jgi:sialate O-acetylesterase